MNSDSLKDKLIIVAEHEEDSANNLTKVLAENGFRNVCTADCGNKIYEVLRPYYNRAEHVGVVIINANLPQCQLQQMCQSLSGVSEGLIIPFVILHDGNSETEFLSEANSFDLSKNSLIHVIRQPVDFKELLLVINFQLCMKQEYFLRHKQEERLINELAERKVIDAKLKYLVAHDELTGLLNRNNFERQLRLILNRSLKLAQDGALLFIDIDRFSVINELEGFEEGDRLLVDLVILIKKIIVRNFLFARIGSDEFCLYLENKNEEQAIIYAEKIKKSVEEFRFFIGDTCYSSSVSIGISTLNTTISVYHPSELILRARQACNNAKENGRNLVWVFNDKDTSVIERRRDIYWVPVIKKALLENELFLVFQPVVELGTGDVSHYEVLIRMKGEDGAIITPGQFIPAAERMGLIHSIDLWVVETAIDFLANLPTSKSHISLAINLSSVAFQDEALLPTIKDKLELCWIDPSRLTFEITETAAVDSFEKTRVMIDKIRGLGCKFALDDFGAGFCSFNYLKSFPVDYVKIDGQFIQNLIEDETDQVLVKSMAQIATKLGKKTIAEFVENPQTIIKLKEIGVNLGQGYIFGKPEKDLLESNSISLRDLAILHRENNIKNNLLSISID